MVKAPKKVKKKNVKIKERVRRTLEEKLEIIELHEAGARYSKIAHDKDMNEASVRKIVKRKDEFRKQAETTAKYGAKSTKWPLSRAKLIMEKSLCVWIENCAQRYTEYILRIHTNSMNNGKSSVCNLDVILLGTNPFHSFSKSGRATFFWRHNQRFIYDGFAMISSLD